MNCIMPELRSLATNMVTLFRNSRPYRIVGVFTLVATIYIAYVTLSSRDKTSSVDPRLNKAESSRLTWRLFESKERTNIPVLGSNYGNVKQLHEYSDTSDEQQEYADSSDEDTLRESATDTAHRLVVESEVTGQVHYLNNATLHKFPPPVPVKCNTDNAQSEILNLKPIEFLPNYKNPCWEEPLNTPVNLLYRKNGFLHYSASYKKVFKTLRRIYRNQQNSPRAPSSSSSSSSSLSQPTRIRCLPYFFISGQPKCGSTDLYKKLITHPHIATPPTKESHWWGKNRYGWILNYSRPIPLSDYVDLYDQASIEIQSIAENSIDNGQDYHPVITGDASVSTLWSNDDWWSNPENCGLTEPLYTNAQHIHHILPNSKIIVILRNPTDRLYSDYLYFRESKSTTDFHQVVESAIDSLNACFDSMGVRSCVYNASIAYGSRLRIRIGLYHVFLQEWLSVFPREQILVLRLEDYAAKPLETMKKVHRFLGLKLLSKKEHEEVMSQPKSNTRRAGDRRLGSMMKETRDLLEAFYRPFNRKLARLMNDDAYLWEN